MKSIKEYISMSAKMMESDEQDEQDEYDEEGEVAEASKKLLNSPDEIDETNPLVKKLVKACDKNGYKLKKAFARLNSSGKPSGWFNISVVGWGSGYHPEIRYNMNGKPGEMFYLHLDLNGDYKIKDAKMYAEGLAKGVAMVELMNSIDGTKLPAILAFTV